ncbi:MAG: hypothetical protein JOZ70_02215 [Pseudolabrys sp.]|nr:hypothetical protein [Pseudolabrys sp.]MBV9954042.1 hypothetical protein [Pseudolabrys sp.]
MAELLSEDDLARARQDPVFRQRFYADHLDRLLDKLNEMRKQGESDPLRAKQIKEGVELAVKLADRLNTKDRPGQAA